MTSLAAPPSTLHAALIDALNDGERERALEQAFQQLSRGGNLPLLLAMTKAMVHAGLAGLALRLLNSSAGLLAADPQLAMLAKRLENLPSGEIASAELIR